MWSLCKHPPLDFPTIALFSLLLSFPSFILSILLRFSFLHSSFLILVLVFHGLCDRSVGFLVISGRLEGPKARHVVTTTMVVDGDDNFDGYNNSDCGILLNDIFRYVVF